MSAPGEDAEGPPIVDRGAWIRDFALGAVAANLVGIAGMIAFVGFMDGRFDGLWRNLGTVLGTAAAAIGSGGFGGALVGALVSDLRAGAGDRWWMLLPLGFPFGAAVGVLEMGAVGVLAGNIEGVALIVGAACGGAVLGLALPLYLVLHEAGKPGWAAVVAAPLVGAFALAAVVGVLEWVY